MHARDGIRRLGAVRRAGSLWTDVAAASIGVALLIGVFLLWRRAVGAIATPLPPAQLAVTAVALLLWAYLAQALVEWRLGLRWAISLPLATILLFAVACSYPGQRLVDWIVWVPTATAFLLAGIARYAIGHARVHTDDARLSSTGRGEKPDAELMQQLTRYRTASGQDVVRGKLTASFAVGERTATLYAAFCPPFERLPAVEAEVVEDEFAATAKLVQVLHNGIQLEVRLARPSPDGHRLAVEFFASEPNDLE